MCFLFERNNVFGKTRVFYMTIFIKNVFFLKKNKKNFKFVIRQKTTKELCGGMLSKLSVEFENIPQTSTKFFWILQWNVLSFKECSTKFITEEIRRKENSLEYNTWTFLLKITK